MRNCLFIIVGLLTASPSVKSQDTCSVEVDKMCQVQEDPLLNPSHACEINPSPCSARLTELTLVYTGEDCSVTTVVGKKIKCIGDPIFEEPVEFVLSPKQAGVVSFHPDAPGASVGIGDSVTLAAVDGKVLPKQLKLDIQSSGSGTMLQSLVIDTSCKKGSLAVGDQIGAVLVSVMKQKDGKELPPEVKYVYTITNRGSGPLSIQDVSDDQLGRISETPFDLDPNEVSVLVKTARILASTVNTVSVMAESSDGGESCLASDTATVVVLSSV